MAIYQKNQVTINLFALVESLIKRANHFPHSFANFLPHCDHILIAVSGGAILFTFDMQLLFCLLSHEHG